MIRAALRPEQTEREIADELEHQIRRFGGAGCSFPPIVAVGAAGRPAARRAHAAAGRRRRFAAGRLGRHRAALLERLDARFGDR